MQLPRLREAASGTGRGGATIDRDDLRRCASCNREVFERVLAPYVALKIENVARSLTRGSRNAWLDASGCVWCVFDDPGFVRLDCGAVAQEGDMGLQVFWSMGDVVMPQECDAAWVAKRIADEAMLQLRALGYHRRRQRREVEGERHEGVLFAKTITRLW